MLDAKDRKHSNTDRLRKTFSNHDMYIIPAEKNNQQVSRGRGKGGLATIWDRSLTKYVAKIECENFRLQATKFALPSGSLLVLNAYFPCVPRTANFDDSQLLNLLTEIQMTIHKSDCSRIWLAGDLNSHFARNTKFTNIVKNFIGNMGLYILWENDDYLEVIPKIDYTHLHAAGDTLAFSTIDHFACSRSLLATISEAGVIHSGEHTSNHSAIYAKILLGNIDSSLNQPTRKPRVSWEKSTDEAKEMYKIHLATKLSRIPIPECANCQELHCFGHSLDLEEYTLDVLDAIETSCQETLAFSGGCMPLTKKVIPGWSEYVRPYQEDSKFWHSLWLSAKKPSTGPLADAMRQSKNQFKYAIRRLKNASNHIQNDKFINCLLQGGQNIYKEIKRFRGTVKGYSSRIDDEVGDTNIANYFAKLYSGLYNRAGPCADFEQLAAEINNEVDQASLIRAKEINDDIIRQALKLMKSKKYDGVSDFMSDCLINGPPELVTHLTFLIRSFVIHGKVPHFILACSLLPIVKDNLGDIISSSNYRAIASGSLLLKLLDIVVILLEGEKFSCDPLQFGFQPKSGTVMCSWTATFVIDYFNK